MMTSILTPQINRTNHEGRYSFLSSRSGVAYLSQSPRLRIC